MPTYLYKCTSCSKEEEVMQKISDPALTTCPFCKAETFKKIPAKGVSIQFKGTGFYKTDYTPNSSSNGGCGKSSCDCH